MLNQQILNIFYCTLNIIDIQIDTMGSKGSKQAGAEKIYTLYGEQGIRNILAQQNSQYQSLSYQRIHQKCLKKTEDIQTRGHQVIDQSIKDSEDDYQQIVRKLQEKEPGIIKKTEANSRKQFKQIIGVEQQIQKYESIRESMVKDFNVSKQKLQGTIRKQVRQHQGVDESVRYPEYHDRQQEQRKQLLEDIEKKYGKKWMQEEEKDRESGNPRKQVFQFHFTDRFQPELQSYIPTQKCKAMRKDIKKNFDDTVKDSMGKSFVCC